ncbi:hypothetical protein HJC22_13510 [Corallococcus exiguus]|uniref:hypothetical protein n=1 Tax=Corallococcus exiguus TaxID=83462 RepID=UPI001470CCA7|nr:hypothetical protein [Corallococcus exiguus]NNC16734.1 hypothetical protein [Corallococcus exiguus]
MSDSKVMVELTRAEALVLFEWLARSDASEALATEEQAERTVLWRLEAELERVLPEPLAPDYKQLLSVARQSVVTS